MAGGTAGEAVSTPTRSADADEGDFSVALKRTAEMAAVFMIGDGVLGLIQPVRHVDLWRSDVGAVDALVKPFGGRPGRRRLYALAQIAAGIALAGRLGLRK